MIPSLVSSLLAAARCQKTDLWLVGGPVRDALLGRDCEDLDMVCRRARRLAQEAARRLKAKWIALDEQNRIYRVILPSPQPSPLGRGRSFAAGEGIRTLDFAELQGKTIEEDLARRDFTINAMATKIVPGTIFENSTRYYFQDILDPFGGRRDLKTKVVRAVSEKAFTEDPLRLLRAFRFQVQFQFTLETRTAVWIRKHGAKITRVSAERIREELLRFWKHPHAGDALKVMDRVGLLTPIFPEVEACRRTAVRYYGRGGVLKHSIEAVQNLEWIFQQPQTRDMTAYLTGMIGGYPRLAWLKWAVFLHDIGKPATAKMIKGRLRFFEHEHVGAGLALQVGKRLRCSRQEMQLLSLWVRNHMRLGNLACAARVTGKAYSRYFRDLGEAGVGMVLVSLADHYTYLSRRLWGKGKNSVEVMGRRLIQCYYEERSKILPPKVINGHDLMRHLRMNPGPKVGKLLAAIQDAQAEGKVTTKAEALAFARRKSK